MYKDCASAENSVVVMPASACDGYGMRVCVCVCVRACVSVCVCVVCIFARRDSHCGQRIACYIECWNGKN